MAEPTVSLGHQTQIGTKNETDYGTAVTVDQRFVYASETIGKRGVILERNGLRGTRSHVADDTRVGPYTVGGALVLEPTPEDLAIWLPRILGAPASGTTYALAETLPSFTLVVDRVAKVVTYAGCKVNRAVFSGARAGYLQLVLEIVGKSESVGSAGTFPSLTVGVTTPFVFNGDTTLTLQGSARPMEQFELVIDNGLITDRFRNSLTIISLPEGDRNASLSTAVGYNAGTGTSGNTDLYDQALAGAAGTLAMAAGNYSLSFAFAKLQVPAESPTAVSRAELMLGLDMIARKSGSTLEVEATLDSTP